MTKQGVAALVAVALMASTPLAVAQEAKIGVVVLERILRDSAAAKAAQQKLEAEFAKRDRELQDMGARLKTGAERFEKDAPVMTETDRVRRQRELAELDREFQRKQREFREDFNQRRNEELQSIIERTNRIIRQMAEQDKYDLIVQEAVYFNPRIDITEKVLRALNNGAK
jgi:outer membrane protein